VITKRLLGYGCENSYDNYTSGPSGAGKTTLLNKVFRKKNIKAKIHPRDIVYHQKNPSKRGERQGLFLYQQT
jgi:ABC-type ATPase involved in cell division